MPSARSWTALRALRHENTSCRTHVGWSATQSRLYPGSMSKIFWIKSGLCSGPPHMGPARCVFVPQCSHTYQTCDRIEGMLTTALEEDLDLTPSNSEPSSPKSVRKKGYFSRAATSIRGMMAGYAGSCRFFLLDAGDMLPGADRDTYQTCDRIEGMLTTALEEDLDLTPSSGLCSGPPHMGPARCVFVPQCSQCGPTAGAWASPWWYIDFIQKILDMLPGADRDTYQTCDRIEGMLTTALEEMQDHAGSSCLRQVV
jgi:hypothetical protein